MLLLAPAAATEAGFPYADETLNYSISWPSGFSLGECRLHATRGADRWDFELTLDAALPGFAIAERHRSTTTAEFCSLELNKDSIHGRKRTRELTAFDARKGVAKRATEAGGKSEIPIPTCPHDALAFLYYTRRELAQGRIPSIQSVFFGAPYQVRLEYAGAQGVVVNEKRTEADRVVVSFKGPASELNFEIFFGRDTAHTPLIIRVPFSLGTFSMELVR